MEIWHGIIFGIIVIAVVFFADSRRNKSYKDYLNRKRGV